MTTPTDTEMIRDVAEGLGWTERMRGTQMNTLLPPMFSTPWGISGNRTTLAAYTMAAMAKRGWWIRPGYDGHDSWIFAARHGYAVGRILGSFDYNPTDPASWAMAVIRCAWEALKGGNDAAQS